MPVYEKQINKVKLIKALTSNTHILNKWIGRTVMVLLLLITLPCWAAEGDFPAWYRTTTALNVRVADNAKARKITTLKKNAEIKVDYITRNNWAAIQYGQQRGYVSCKYIRYVRDAQVATGNSASTHNNTKKTSGGWLNLWNIAFNLGMWTLVIVILRKIAIGLLGIISVFMYKVYWVVCIPFYVMNWLQRHLSKPWRILYKTNSGNDAGNKRLRNIYKWIKIPIYVALTPLRFVNAVYFNMVVHCCFEMYNYVIEIFLPSNEKEGEDNLLLMIVLIPWRVLRYVVWHGSLTFIEAGIWTIVDTFVPALTLFHGTSEVASTTITHAGRSGYSNYLSGIWNVGTGNYAGNGIYFAPARSTSLHYSSGALIVCRVSLGKVLDLGLAPWHVYRQCGYRDALGATKWGLNNGYVTGEWWRKDRGWWEYCMYDWQNRYNYSWRIRPLYVLNLNEQMLQRIPGGMAHWLFRKMVICDIFMYFKEALKS